MGKNGRKAVLEKYDYSIVSKQWSDLINEWNIFDKSKWKGNLTSSRR
jgi:hypothetical protein